MSESVVEEIVQAIVPGNYAWYLMAAGILAYDVFAIQTKKYETMSGAIWRSLSNPKSATKVALGWLILTHHLFANKQARTSYSVYLNKTRSQER